jgi:hypothetical protein
MVGVRDDKLIAAKTNELRLLLGDAIGKFLEAQKAQLDEITTLKAEIKELRGRDTEKQRYELKNLGAWGVRLHAEARGPRRRTTALALPNMLRKRSESIFPVFCTHVRFGIGLPLQRV